MLCDMVLFHYSCDYLFFFFFFKQKTAYEMRISDWSSDVCSSDLVECATGHPAIPGRVEKMSKSKKNVVDPSPIIDQYGADAVRWFMLSDSPPERDQIGRASCRERVCQSV